MDAPSDKAISRYVHEGKFTDSFPLPIEEIAAAHEIYNNLKFIRALRNDVKKGND